MAHQLLPPFASLHRSLQPSGIPWQAVQTSCDLYFSLRHSVPRRRKAVPLGADGWKPRRRGPPAAPALRWRALQSVAKRHPVTDSDCCGMPRKLFQRK